MKAFKIHLFALVLLTAATVGTQAQEKNYYRMERLKADNPWLTSYNAAGLVTNTAERFSIIEGGWQYENGKFRNVHDPSRLNGMNLRTESLLHLNKLYFYGKFSFDYKIRNHMGWTNVLSPYDTPIYVADSIPGEQTLEVYHIDGGVSYPLGKHFAVGAQIRYETTSNAKHKDARNQNTYMSLTLCPGVMFRSGPLRLGASMIYQKMTEFADIKIIGTGKIHEVFEFEGLWHYKSTVLSEGNTMEREYKQKIYGGAFQIEFSGKNFNFFNEFSVTQRRQDIYPNSFTNERSGKLKERNYSYNGLLHKSTKNYDHYLSLQLKSANYLTYENIQQIEIIDQNEVWVQYGIKNKSSVDRVDADISYRLFKNRTAYNSSWDAEIGARGFYVKKTYRLYPANFIQKAGNYEGYLSFNKNFLRDQGMFDCKVNLTYGIGEGKKLKTEMEAEGEIPGEDQYKRRNDLLEKEYDFLTSDHYRGTLSLRYTRFINKSKGMTLYGDARFCYSRSLDGCFAHQNRTAVSTCVGFTF